MQKIGASTASANALGEFTEGNPGAGVEATLLKASWLNAIQRELVNLIEGAGLTLTAADDSQLLKAVQAIQSAANTWAKLGGKPTTIGGFGIADAYTKTETVNAINAAVAALVASSPAALDTLKELADALGNDPNFAVTITNAIAGKASIATSLAGYGITDAYNKVDTEYLISQAVKGLAKSATTLAGYGITDAYKKLDTEYLISQAVTALLPKRSFAFNDFIRIPDVVGGLVIQMGSAVVPPEASLEVSLPISFNAIRGVVAGMGVSGWNTTGNYSAYAVPVSNGVIRLTQDASTSSGAGNQTIYFLAWGN